MCDKTQTEIGPRTNLSYVYQWLKESLEGVSNRGDAHIVLHRNEVDLALHHLERASGKLSAESDLIEATERALSALGTLFQNVPKPVAKQAAEAQEDIRSALHRARGGRG